MNAPSKKPVGTETVSDVIAAMDARSAGLLKLREPFPDNLISKLPKPTKAQTDAVKADFKAGIRCKECGAWHHPQVVHLDYVGHAALTHRLLDVDPEWSWEPASLDERGLPAFDSSGGLWIKLTVCGVTRLGYGHAATKPNQDPGAREKEAIGDALRNAAMRFGAALDLWHKGDLHADDENERPVNNARPTPVAPKHDEPSPFISEVQRDQIALLAEAAGVSVKKICDGYGIDNLMQLHADSFEKCVTKLRKLADAKSAAPLEDVLADDVPY